MDSIHEITTVGDKTKARMGCFNVEIDDKGNHIRVYRRRIYGKQLLFDSNNPSYVNRWNEVRMEIRKTYSIHNICLKNSECIDCRFKNKRWVLVDDLNKRLHELRFKNPKNQYERAWNSALDMVKVRQN